MSNTNIAQNNKRIVTNTIMLYIRMAITLAIAFFTTRELLRVLGADDFGTVNLISSVVTMFSFLSSMISVASSRFFNIELGKKNYLKLRQLFSITVYIYIALVVILFILSETIGLWVFNNKVEIPPQTLESARYFFHFTIITFLFNVMTIPYNAIVISNEDMRMFAVESVLTAIAKLAVVYALTTGSSNNIILYGALLALISIVRFLGYMVYALKNYSETKLMLYWNNKYAKELISFGGWNIFGAILSLINVTFINVLLNNYFGVAINATRAIAMQISAGVSGFTGNFLTAIKPQIMQYWGAGNKEKSHKLTRQASRLSFFLVFIFALPILIKTETVLNLWLSEIPEYCVIFTRLILIHLLIFSLSYPLMTLIQATGKIALYQTIVGGTLLLNLPISYLAFRLGYPPDSTMVIAVFIEIIALFLRVIIIKLKDDFSILCYFKNVIYRIVAVSTLSCILPFITNNINTGFELINLSIVTISCFLSSGIFIITLGFSKDEKKFIFSLILNKIKK